MQFIGCKIGPSPENSCELCKMYAYKHKNNIQMHKMRDAQMFYDRGFRDEGYYLLFIFSIFETP